MAPGLDLERAGFLMDENWIVIAGTNDWFQFTRVFRRGYYRVHAALSSPSTRAGGIAAELSQKTGGGPGGDWRRVGSFLADGSGAWGNNKLVPLANANPYEDLELLLDGPVTFRLNFKLCAGDYLLFNPVPLGGVRARLVRGNGGDRFLLEWRGEGEVESSMDPNGPFAPTGWKESPYDVHDLKPQMYYRVRPLNPR
ncbi:MAG: hypothetical protein FJ405_04810 [Verrucomicrobia bacterium]|nr:hypothetical protein [Verrucomicrobiota bacterium]